VEGKLVDAINKLEIFCVSVDIEVGADSISAFLLQENDVGKTKQIEINIILI
jgi:hypothetical protein